MCKTNIMRRCLRVLLILCLIASSGCKNDHGRTWSVYRADAASSSYSPLAEIDRSNVSRLELAWTFNPNDARDGARSGNAECNPIIIDGTMYATSARHRLY